MLVRHNLVIKIASEEMTAIGGKLTNIRFRKPSWAISCILTAASQRAGWHAAACKSISCNAVGLDKLTSAKHPESKGEKLFMIAGSFIGTKGICFHRKML